MKNSLRILALVVALAAAGTWLVTGSNQGWTKTSIEKRILDEVTGIDEIKYEKAFKPGLDFLGGALLGAGALAGVSLLFRTKPNENHPQ
ncbi:MAG: hypothetical protein IPK15_02530 [Verrucomicrobia bacterium]|nr:hypothetical protein [Verrucomicrobiota bacterium]